ncbi:Nitrogen assimilation transcription factor nit-4 [Grifola frondosa]|uniref:Nitrogen assimilation transcription factor nit-4 n=1 Tax=Grifola frondosa TaxID=5627 RepID=A0A1C7LT20_GRIFR|nr:Nitrogen assimilation transcription factor nit-4 [Grifola frondosa]
MPDRESAEISENDTVEPGGSSAAHNSKRSARACDRCRKSKSKCEPSSSPDRCKTCAAVNQDCTFSGPSFRRGPPKGYIKALENRLHQVESVLAAIMSSQDIRSMGVVSDLRRDELARNILDRVDSGPFGPSGRLQRSVDPTQDNFFASIVEDSRPQPAPIPPKDSTTRKRRQSRATRENVIHEDPLVFARPTLAWQDSLSESLSQLYPPSGGHTTRSTSFSAYASGSATPFSDRLLDEPARRRRRLEGPSTTRNNSRNAQLDELSTTTDTDPDALDDCADAFGNLSLDENREVRYHGNSSGLHLLAQTDRTDNRNVGGIWNFPMARFWPGIDPGDVEQDANTAIALPPVNVQDHLVQVYFTYVNPSYPVVDRESFMAQYNAQSHQPKIGYPDPNDITESTKTVQPARAQKLSNLLLFAMFAFAAQYSSTAGSSTASRYSASARRILDTMYQESRSSTCQALILLGVREFGVGSLEEGWLHIGMAMRMALDLGLNRNPDKWQHNGDDLFSPQEKIFGGESGGPVAWQTRRPIAVHEGDFSSPLPDVSEGDAEETWQPCLPDPRTHSFAPISAWHESFFRHVSSLSVIVGEILEKIFPVTRVTPTPRRILKEEIYSRLLQWHIDLPECLAYSSTSTRPCPPPHVLVLHIQYWAAVLLLHRPFIPKGTGLNSPSPSPSIESDPVPWKSFDICQCAANHAASYAMIFHENYDLKWSPPFLCTHIQAAGIMHIITLKHRPHDTQAMSGLRNCISAVAGMQATWPSAARVRDLLQGAKVHLDKALVSSTNHKAGQKRPADHAFPQETSTEILRTYQEPQVPVARPQIYNETVAQDGQLTAHMLGMDIPQAGTGMATFTGFLPGASFPWVIYVVLNSHDE